MTFGLFTNIASRALGRHIHKYVPTSGYLSGYIHHPAPKPGSSSSGSETGSASSGSDTGYSSFGSSFSIPGHPTIPSGGTVIPTIPVFDRLRQWLHTKGLQGYLRVADVKPHPCTAQIVNQINVAKITNKQVRQFLNLKMEGFDGMAPLKPEVLRLYFGKYSPSAKAYKTQGGEDELFQEVAKFIF